MSLTVTNQSLYALNLTGIQVPIDAAFLYDAVKMYAEAAHVVIEAGGDLRDGQEIVRTIINRGEYHSDFQGKNVRKKH